MPDAMVQPINTETGEIESRFVSGVEVKKQFWRSKKSPEDWIPVQEKNWHYWTQCQVSMQVWDVESWHFFVSNEHWGAYELVHRDNNWWTHEALPAFKTWMIYYEETLARFKEEALINK
jgi:hypothetical protein